ncbi:MAG: magnesium transporter [Lachnospirales bacterium]
MEQTLLELLKKYLEYGEHTVFYEYLEDSSPVDIGAELEDFEDDELDLFCKNIEIETLAEIINESYAELQLRLLKTLDNGEVLKVFKLLPKDEIVDILGFLPSGQKKTLLNMMQHHESEVLEKLLNYAEDTAGGIMTTEYIALRSTITVSNALIKIKQIAPKTEVIETLFVINNSREFVGTVDLRDILVADDNVLLEDIMDTHILSVYPDDDQEQVSLLATKYSLTVIPVVNRRQALLGIITIDDILDVIQEEYTEDILKMAGVDKDETIGNSLVDSVKKRLPWLCVNFFTALLASSIVGLFDETIDQVVALAVAMPIIAGMGGNAGSQTLSIVIRNIALGEIEPDEYGEILKKEISLGLLHGISIGILTAIVMYIVYHNIYFSLISLLAMIFNMTQACILGFLVPTTLKKLKIDPALCSGIFLTTATDTLGFFVFLGIASVFIEKLV